LVVTSGTIAATGPKKDEKRTKASKDGQVARNGCF
jgi:hypothetical protein